MGQVSKYLRSAKDAKGTQYFMFWCPGCEEPHQYRVGGETPDPKWTFNGNVDRPTFTPSLLCFTDYSDQDDADGKPIRLPEGQRRTLCHLFVTDGQIVYCGDNPHKLNGQTVPLPELPDYMQDDKFGDAS